MDLATVVADDARRRALFPVVDERIYLAHAGVAPLCGPAAGALAEFARRGSVHSQERGWSWQRVADARAAAGALLGAAADEIALLGPTALGLNLVAHGVAWRPGDEVVYYRDDYPANVYPWSHLEGRGVVPRPLEPELPGVITWEVVERALSGRTRLVALASCNFLSGYRVDLDGIGRRLRERGILVCVDGIQTLGAFPTPAGNVDFLAADSHKWLLGPCGAGVFLCRRERLDELRPALLGAGNVHSPQFIAQDEIALAAGAQRFEPGTLNLPGIVAMAAGMELLRDLGVERIARRILDLRARLLAGLRERGWRPILADLEDAPDADRWRSGILSVTHDGRDLERDHRHLLVNGAVTSLRHDRAGGRWLRFSPHAYQREDELDRVVALLD